MRKPTKNILWSALWMIGACWLWYAIVGNPLHDLALLQRAQVVTGFITDTDEDTGEDDYGRLHWSHNVTYAYQLSDGREFTATTNSFPGRLPDQFQDVEYHPYPIEVEYLPDHPSISRIKGTGSDTIFEFIWRKVGLGGLLLIMFLAPGLDLLWHGIREQRGSSATTG